MVDRVVAYWFTPSSTWQQVADASSEDDAKAQAGPFIAQSSSPTYAWVHEENGWRLEKWS
jgi:hypothetical protein